MGNKGCLAMQVRVSRVTRVVSGSSSLPGAEISLQMEISFMKGKCILYFQAVRGG